MEGQGKGYKDKEVPLIVFSKEAFSSLKRFFIHPSLRSALFKHSYGKENALPIEINSCPADFKEESFHYKYKLPT